MPKNRKNQSASDAESANRATEATEQSAQTATISTEAAALTAPSPKQPSKQQQLAALVVRDEGATLEQMIAATGWLPHTTRAALTGLKNKGFTISSDKVDGVRTYRGIAPE